MNPKILFVDDDANLLAAFQRNLRSHFTFETALGGLEALELLQNKGPFALILADMNMPGMKGTELLEQVRERYPDVVRMMLTGNADQQTAVDAVNRGAIYRFLNKPCPIEDLIPALESGLKFYELLRIERELLEGTLTGSVKMLTDVLGMVAPDALGRGQRLRKSMDRFAKHLGVGPLWELDLAALLVNIGYAVVPQHVLQKLGSGSDLFPKEKVILQRAPRTGHDLLVDIPRLRNVARIILYQNANFDGTGFPGDGVAGTALPLASRMLKILNDRLDLEIDGVVKKQAYDILRSRDGFYDPDLLPKCFECFGDFLASTISSDRPVVKLSVTEIRPGDIVVSDISTKSGLSLVRSNTVLTTMIIERLRNFSHLNELSEPLLLQRAQVEAPEPAAASA